MTLELTKLRTKSNTSGLCACQVGKLGVTAALAFIAAVCLSFRDSLMSDLSRPLQAEVKACLHLEAASIPYSRGGCLLADPRWMTARGSTVGNPVVAVFPVQYRAASWLDE